MKKINLVNFNSEPLLFVDIEEFSIDENREHRRGSNFYVSHIVELKESDKKYFEGVDNFDDYIGTWSTNTIIWDSEYGRDEDFSELTRVERKVKVIEEVSWEQVK